MALNRDWNLLLKYLEQLHNRWLKKAETTADDRWIRGVLFGIEVGSKRIVEEVANLNPAIPAIIAEWRSHLRSREVVDAQEIIKGVDHGIKLVIDCVFRFFEKTSPDEPLRSDPKNRANGNETEGNP
jgi:hypothetical protein